jgi:hypothetical protein
MPSANLNSLRAENLGKEPRLGLARLVEDQQAARRQSYLCISVRQGKPLRSSSSLRRSLSNTQFSLVSSVSCRMSNRELLS